VTLVEPGGFAADWHGFVDCPHRTADRLR
jgi:hypothetical protein